MVLLVQRLSKLYCKLENHHHHHRPPQPDEASSASFLAFRSSVSSSLNQLLLGSKPGGLETLSLKWIQQCFQVLPFINKAFAKLVVEIDYHMSQWKAESMEAYLKYSLEMLDLLNSISSSISCLVQARLSLCHALSLFEAAPSSPVIDRLKEIELERLGGNHEFKDRGKNEAEKERSSSDKEGIVLQALMEMRSVGLWLCGIVLAGLCSDVQIYQKMRKSAGKLSNPSLINLDSSIHGIMMEKGCVLKEVKELKDSAAFLATAAAGETSSTDVAEELQRKLKMFEKMLDDLGKEVNGLFSEVLSGRDELLNGIRFQKQ